MKKIICTGTRGFIGRNFVQRFTGDHYDYKIVALLKDMQKPPLELSKPIDSFPLFSQDNVLEKEIYNASYFFHFAGRAHQSGSFEVFHESNVDLTLRLAKIAKRAHVKNFVYISSVAVFGDVSKTEPFSIDSLPHPKTPYALSKLRAEEALKELFKDKETHLIIIRPPLIYAPYAPGNLQKLRQSLKNGIPMPFLGLQNKRAILYLGDFLDLCEEVIEGTHESFELILPVSDHLATPDIYNTLANDLNLTAKMIKTPLALIKLLQKLPFISSRLNKTINKLIGNFHIIPNWIPVKKREEGKREEGKREEDKRGEALSSEDCQNDEMAKTMLS